MFQAYLIGAMEFSDDEGETWRRDFSKSLNKLNINCIIPNDEEANIKNGINIKELKLVDICKYKEIMKKFIKMDLKFVEDSDMLICKWENERTAGTTHEVGYGYQLGKSNYLVTSVEEHNIPGWFLTCFTKVFKTKMELIDYLKIKPIFIVDIDGTICDSTHRIEKTDKLMGDDEIEWNEELVRQFIEESVNDNIVPGSNKIINIAKRLDASIIFLTGREENMRKQTTDWLKSKFNVKFKLFMRPNNLDRIIYSSFECKEEVFKKNILSKFPEARYIFFDDDERTCKLYSKYGLVLKAPQCWEVLL